MADELAGVAGMRKARIWSVVPAAVLAVVLFVPVPVAAFWSGPGCFVANMMTGGAFSGGIGFSMGGRGATYAPPYGVAPPYARPHPVGPGAAWMSPASPNHADGATLRRAADLLQENVWSSELREPPHAVGIAPGPRNRWQP